MIYCNFFNSIEKKGKKIEVNKLKEYNNWDNYELIRSKLSLYFNLIYLIELTMQISISIIICNIWVFFVIFEY